MYKITSIFKGELMQKIFHPLHDSIYIRLNSDMIYLIYKIIYHNKHIPGLVKISLSSL